jgi:hypothetical protein
MKKPVPRFLLLSVIVLIMSSCSASLDRTSSAEQEINGDLRSQDGQIRPQGGEQKEDVVENSQKDTYSPTASPLFEQDYGWNETSDRDYSDLEIITLLPPDGIPALNFPNYYSIEEANQEYTPEELVIGVEFNGDARAYSINLLSRHEIVNDTVGGIHLAVTW